MRNFCDSRAIRSDSALAEVELCYSRKRSQIWYTISQSVSRDEFVRRVARDMRGRVNARNEGLFAAEYQEVERLPRAGHPNSLQRCD